MITMVIKLNKKHIMEQPLTKNYPSLKAMTERFIIAKGRGVFVSNKEIGNIVKDVVFPLITDFIWAYEDIMDDFSQWKFIDERGVEVDVLDMYNKYGRQRFETEIIPEIRDYKRIRGAQLKARLLMQRKKYERTHPQKPTAEEPLAEIPKEVPFDDETPF